jgi:hypothetical protein
MVNRPVYLIRKVVGEKEEEEGFGVNLIYITAHSNG